MSSPCPKISIEQLRGEYLPSLGRGLDWIDRHVEGRAASEKRMAQDYLFEINQESVCVGSYFA